MSPPLVVSYGGGDNSAGLLVGHHERGERPDAIVMSDTGNEKPRTYGHLLVMQRWCERVGFPSIQIIRASTPMSLRDGTLGNECVRLGTIPSRAMGLGSCSDKWKIDPFEKWLKTSAFYGDCTIEVGYHAGEPERASRRERYNKPCRYPLIEWDWDADDCRAAIRRAGLPLPGKSACDFCPSSKAHEIVRLARLRPKRMADILEMERVALAGEGQAPALHSCKGLGRRFSWASLLRKNAELTEALGRPFPWAQPAKREPAHAKQAEMFDLTPEECGQGCFT